MTVTRILLYERSGWGCFLLVKCRNCSETSKISKNMYKMLAFLRMFLKFYLVDTPHRRNA